MVEQESPFLDRLYRAKCVKPTLDSRLFDWAFSLTSFMNPVGAAAQVWSALFVDTAGVSVSTWVMFALIQVVAAGFAVKVRHLALFIAMAISFCESVTIVLAVLLSSQNS